MANYVRSFQDTEGRFCDVLSDADYQGYTITLFQVEGTYVVDGTNFKRTHFANLQDAMTIYNDQRLVNLAKRFGNFETVLIND